jgi:transcriptional regulator with XRE-family HTH domain
MQPDYMTTIDMKATGARIRRLRMERGLTVEELRQCLNLSSPRAIYKWQSGKNMPTMDNLLILCKALGAQLEDILVLIEKEQKDEIG